MYLFHFFLFCFIAVLYVFQAATEFQVSSLAQDVQAYNSVKTETLKAKYLNNISEKKKVVFSYDEEAKVLSVPVIPEPENSEPSQVENDDEHLLSEEEKKEKERIAKILQNNAEHLRQNGSRSYRNNNPGNLRYTGQKGSIGKDQNGFAIFETYESGKLAHLRQIDLDASRGYTLGDFVKKFAPKEENLTEDYTAFLLRRFPDFNSNTPVSQMNSETLQVYMQRMEGWIEPENTANDIESNSVELVLEAPKRKVIRRPECEGIEDVKERIACVRS